jgi:hypothetical protein
VFSVISASQTAEKALFPGRRKSAHFRRSVISRDLRSRRPAGEDPPEGLPGRAPEDRAPRSGDFF